MNARLSLESIQGPPKTLPASVKMYLCQLSSQKSSSAVSDFLSLFDHPRERCLDVFKTGIQKFVQCANLNSSKRQEFYGNPYLGLHYRNDLTQLWNTENPEKSIRAEQLISFCPDGWEVIFLKNYPVLVYKGNKPSQALNQLLQGPTIVDCGQLCELAVIFGIRYILGNSFDKYFGKTPFFITPIFDEPIKNPLEPIGNPWYPFFRKVGFSELKTASTSVYKTYVYNHPDYQIRHPAGFYDGENCLVIDGKYMIFDPPLEKTMDLTRENVEQLLWQQFNRKQDEHDQNTLHIYAENPTVVHIKLKKTYEELISLAKDLSDIQLDEKVWKLAVPEADKDILLFDFEYFCAWVEKNETPSLTVEYTPHVEEKSTFLLELIEKFPYENRKMSFANFKVNSPLQAEIRKAALKFCADIMQGESCCVIFSGQAGIGKTTAAVCCAKELALRKKFLWISEGTVNNWLDKTIDLADVPICREKIRSLLTDDIEVVFLDDINLIGYAGETLLAEIYSWYVVNSKKGLLITSNVEINFEKCFGVKFFGEVPVPFLNYNSKKYENTLIFSSLQGNSLRLQPDYKITDLSDEQKIEALLRCHTEQSIGIIISYEAYLAQKHLFNQDLEFVPAIDDKLLDSIQFSLRYENTSVADSKQLDDKQKEWLEQFEYYEGSDFFEVVAPQQSVRVRPFEKSKHAFIAIEILSNSRMEMNSECLCQMLRIIHYAHDHGGKKLIVINRTSFSSSVCLEKMKEKIGGREKERTISRMNTIFFSPDLTTTAMRCSLGRSITSSSSPSLFTHKLEPIRTISDKVKVEVLSEVDSKKTASNSIG